ncbi:MAG: heme exporter protein CcmD [Alphaproteobacteria bacterium]|nr:heme exporter protein CcmD [Alphaproteobacteria bacterium]
MAMGGYGTYVWPAFGVVLAVMALLWFASMRGWRKSELDLRALRESRRQEEIAKE